VLIYVQGKHSVVSTKKVKKIVNFFADKLFSKRMNSSLSLTVIFSKSETVNEGLMGWCDWIDDNRRPKEFEIAISPITSEKAMIVTIAHEMRHLYQFAHGHLTDLSRKPGHVSWKGKTFHDTGPYSSKVYLSPWEKDARKYEKILYKAYLEEFEE